MYTGFDLPCNKILYTDVNNVTHTVHEQNFIWTLFDSLYKDNNLPNTITVQYDALFPYYLGQCMNCK